jgi:hypothetical protein
MPIPDSADFRVELDAGQLQRARESIDRDGAAALENATKDVLARMLPPLRAMAEKLVAYRVSGTGKDARVENPFRDSLVGNLKELADFLPAMNLTGDSNVAAMIDRIADLADERSPEEYRADRVARESGANKAASLASEVESILSAMGGDSSDFLAIAAE